MYTMPTPPRSRRSAVCLLIAAVAMAGLAGGAGEASDAPAAVVQPGSGEQPVSTPHFRITPAAGDAGLAALGGQLERLFDRHVQASRAAGFAVRMPARPLDWVWASPLDAARGGEATGEAYYSSEDDCVVIRPVAVSGEAGGPGGETPALPSTVCLSHELAHQLAFHTGLQTRGVLYAFWLSEGLAANFEAALPGSADFCGENPYRQERLVAAGREGRLLPLADLLVRTEAPREWTARDYGYAQAWGLVRFLYRRDPAAFRCYMSLQALRPPGRRPDAALQREFVQAFGPLADVEGDWRSFVAGLDAGNDKPDGLVLNRRAAN